MTTTRYSRYHRVGFTDDLGETPWIACDESGQDGENLAADTEVLAHGSVRYDDTQAAEVIAVLRAELPRSQRPELKFAQCDNLSGAATLAWALGSDGPLHGRAHVFLTHKLYVIMGKTIDLLVEEFEHDRGRDIYSNGEARAMARTLFRDGPRALGPAGFARLAASFVSLFRVGQLAGGDDKETIAEFFATVDQARWSCHRRNVEQLLDRIRAAQQQAEEFQRSLADSGDDNIPALDPLIPSVMQTIRFWAPPRGVRGLRVLHDRQNVLTDDRVDVLLAQLRAPLPEFRRFTPPVSVDEFVRGDSAEHPSLQLADVIAGAGRAAAEGALGVRTDPVATALIDIIGPIVAADSLWADKSSWRRMTARALTD